MMLNFGRTFATVGTSDQVLESSSNHSASTDDVVDLKGDQIENNEIVKNLNLNYKHLWALAITTGIGGHYFAWNEGLSAGFGTYMIVTVIISSGFICLIFTLAELSSALPFAGGAYGIARVTLGIFPGFIVACLDSFKSILYVASSALAIGNQLTYCTGLSTSLEPAYWFAFFAVAVAINSYGGKTLWWTILLLAALSMSFLIMYIAGSIKFADLAANAPLSADDNSTYEQWFHGGMYEFMHVLPLPCWFFVGIQSINLACTDIVSPKSEVPKGFIAAMCTALCTSFSVILVACSLSPGVPVLMTRTHPLTTGYMHMFSITRSHATIISLPATIGSGFGFMYFFGQQLRAMGLSGLLNPICARELSDRHTPVGALVIGSLFSYALCLLIHFKPFIREYTYNISMMGAIATYLSIFLSFWIFRNHYPTITREFVSPVGIPGALFGFLVFALAFIAICGFQKTQVSMLVFVGFVLTFSVYYYAVVQKRQVFSEEEKTVMFKAYLVKGNTARTNRLKKGGRMSVNTDGAVPRAVSRQNKTKTPVSAASNTATDSETTLRQRWVQEQDKDHDKDPDQNELELQTQNQDIELGNVSSEQMVGDEGGQGQMDERNGVSLLSPIREGEGGDMYADSYHSPHSSVPVAFGGLFSTTSAAQGTSHHVNDVVENSSAFDKEVILSSLGDVESGIAQNVRPTEAVPFS